METSRNIKLFRNGRNQALRIPRDMELEGDSATIRKEGNCLIIEPAPSTGLLATLAKLKPLDIDFDTDGDLPPLDDIEL